MKECNQCGKCCIQYSDGGLVVTTEEIDWWETARPDIYAYINNGEIWFDPKTKKRLSRCPFLKHDHNNNIYHCSIYHDRPDDCKHYPTSIAEMVRDECEMIEVKDLINIKHAQKLLDDLMSDSRPPLT